MGYFLVCAKSLGCLRVWPTKRQAVQGMMLCVLGGLLAGCQGGSPTVSNRILLAHLPGIDFSGLARAQYIPAVKVAASIPSTWHALKLQSNPIYSHQQWKAPSGYTGTGIFHVNMPLPFDAHTLLWFAKAEYAKKAADGKPLGEWTDPLGRPWFEAENDKYHVRGYAVTQGLDAWIVYYGYKTTRPVDADELSLAGRSIDTVLPQTQPPPAPSMADAGKSGPGQRG